MVSGIDLLALDRRRARAPRRDVFGSGPRIVRYRRLARPCAHSPVGRERAEHALDQRERPPIAPTASSTGAEQDRERHPDEEHLHLRHQAREHAEAEIE